MEALLPTDEPHAVEPQPPRAGCNIRLGLHRQHDNVIASLQSGYPLSWHSQRCDALVTTTKGIAFYGQADGQPAAISADARVSLGALGTKPLGLCAYGDLACTLSNPSILMDLSETGTAVIMALLYVDGTTMLNAMRIFRVQAGRHPRSAPVDHMCFAFCTNEGVLASKFYGHEVLRKHLQTLRTCRKGGRTPPREPVSQLVVWHSGHEPINDFVVRLRHPERNVADVVVCYDADRIDVCTAQFRSLGGSLQVIFVRHQRISFGSPSPNEPVLHEPLSASQLSSIAPPSLGHVHHEATTSSEPSMAPSLRNMTSYFTYLAYNATGSVLVATADMDKLIVVFGQRKASEDDASPPRYSVRFTYALDTASSERPYKVVCVGGDVFVVACQHVLIGIDAFNGTSTVLRCAGPQESICGLCTTGHRAVYVALTWLEATETATHERRILRVDVDQAMGPSTDSPSEPLLLRTTVEESHYNSAAIDQCPAGRLTGMFNQGEMPGTSLREWCSAWLHAAVSTSHCIVTRGLREALYVAGRHLCRQSHPLMECGGGSISPVAPSCQGSGPVLTNVEVKCSSCSALVNSVPYLVCPVCNEVLCEACFVAPASMSLPSS